MTHARIVLTALALAGLGGIGSPFAGPAPACAEGRSRSAFRESLPPASKQRAPVLGEAPIAGERELQPGGERLACTLVGSGTPVTRYRLYSPTTLEHLYTTDLFEYTVLGTRGWNQEGSTGTILNGPASRDGLAAIPFYRLYHAGIRQHHWTTDANEYAELATRGWTQEGIDGYLFTTADCAAVPLYRLALNAPPLHLWTTDANEYAVLAAQGWIQEGIAGYLFGPPPLEPPVCARWRADYPELATSIWTGNTAGCDQGTVNPVAITDAVRRTNLFRFLVGLPPIVENATFSANVQAASVILRGLDTLTHTPEPTDPCYTAAGDLGCGSSNLAQGASSLAAAVDLYIGDIGIDSLGHRRWLLYPPYAEGGFGFVRSGNINFSFSGQWVFGFGPDPAPAYVAYPAPGPFPFEALLGRWSFSLKDASFASATVQVVRLSDNAVVGGIGTYVPDGGFGLNTLAWDVPGAAAGQSYRVTILGVGSAPQSTYVYTTELRACP